jgi:hypothetical protein
MRNRLLALATCVVVSSAFIIVPASGQQNSSASQASEPVEGTVVSSSRDTLVVRTDDNQFQLFTYDRGVVRPRLLIQGTRVRVTAGPADENGTRSASNVVVVSAVSGGGAAANDKGAQAAPVPEKVRNVESEIRRESRRWRIGVRAGTAFDPELFMFGLQSQMGPIFHPRVLFRPNAEFDFGEVTDMIALNLEAIYRFPASERRGNWTPYIGAGPALIFIHQSFQSGRDIDFGNFDYETGFNILAGIQSRRGLFGEMRTSLWSGPAPKLHLIVGYNF